MANPRVGLEAVFEVAGFSNGLGIYLKGVVQAEQKTTQAASSINASGAAIASGFGAAMGTVAVDAIQGFIRSSVDAVTSALGLASSFEQIEFSMRALSASQKLLAGSTEDFNTLFTESEDEVKGYILLLEDIAIPSIFTTQQLASVMQMFQSFGFLAGEAFVLTEAMTNFATASNASSERMNRVAYAMSQVRSEGRLLATEVKQFSQASIPIIEILSDGLNKTQGEIRDMMKDGLLTADLVFPILIDYFNNFDGVTAEAQNTLRGLFSTLVDISEISTKNFTLAVLDSVVPTIKPLIDLLKDESIRAGATALGELLGPRLAVLLQSGITALQGFLFTLTSLSPQTIAFFAVLAGGAAVFTAFAGAVGIISIAIGALVTSFTLTVGAVAFFVAAYSTNFGNIATITNTVVNAVISTIQNVVNGFGDFASGIADALNAAASAMGDFLGQVADWGTAIVSALADGISSAVSIVVDAISVLASAMAYLMAPGSPPRMLPKLTEWGKETANEWLIGWTQADFGILGDIGNFVEQALGKDASADQIISVNQIIAQAVDEIRNLGQVSADTFGQIEGSLGSASDEVFGYLERYRQLAQATTFAEAAQNKLNIVTREYDAILAPLQQNLDKATEAVTRAKEAQEAKGLERLLQTSGVSTLRRQEAIARLQQISARQQVVDVEEKKQAAVDAIQVELDAATKLQEQAQKQLDLFQQRIQLQTQYLTLIEQEQNKASSGASGAAKAAKEGLSALEKQLKLIQLQQQELQDLIAGAKARKVLEDENATAAQKTAAQMELQAIAVRQQLRDIEAAELGGNLAAIREIQIVAADLEKPGKDGKLKGIASDLKIISDADPEGRFAKFRKEVDEMTASFTKFGTEIQTTASTINANLPAFLRFWNEEGVSGPPPLITNLVAALSGFAAFKFTSIVAGLLALGPAGTIAAAGIGLFIAAFQGDWFGIRDDVIEVVEQIKVKFGELRTVFNQGFTGGQTSTSDQLRGTSDPIEGFALKIGQFAAKVVEDIGKIAPAFTKLQTDLNAIFGGEGTLFGKLTASALAVSEAFGANSAVMLALGAFTTFMSVRFAPLLAPAAAALYTLLGPIGIAALAIGGLHTIWTKDVGGIKTYTETNFPAVGTAITAVMDTITAVFQKGIDLIAQFQKDLASLKLSEEAAGVKGGAVDLPRKLVDILGGVIFTSFNAALDLISEQAKNAAKANESSGLSKSIGEALGRAMVDLIGIAITQIPPTLDNIAETVNDLEDAFISILQQYLDGMVKGVSERVGEIIVQHEEQLQKMAFDIANVVAGFYNSLLDFLNVFQAINGAEPLEKIEIPVFLTSDMFKVTPPGSVTVNLADDIFKLTGQQLLDSAEVFRIKGENKIAVPAEAVFAINPDLREVIPPSDLIEVNGEQKILLTPLQLAALEAGSPIQYAPDEVFSLDLSKPIVTQIPLSPDFKIEDVSTSISDTLRSAGGIVEAAQAAAKQFSDTFGLQKIAPPVIDTGDPLLNAAGTAAGLQFVQGFTSLPAESQKKMIENILTLPTDQSAELLKAGLGAQDEFVNGFVPSETNIEKAKTLGKLLGIDIVAGVTEGAKPTETDLQTFTNLIQSVNQAMIDKAEANSPSLLSKRTVGLPMGEGVVKGAEEAMLIGQPILTATLTTILTNMSTLITTFQTTQLAEWTTWTTNIQTVITNSYTSISSSTAIWIADILAQYIVLRSNLESTIRSMTSSVTSLFAQMHSAVISRLNSMISEILSKLRQLIKDIQEEFVEKGKELGNDFADGIIQGMTDKIEEVYAAGYALGEAAVQAGKDAVAAGSPSEESRKEIGQSYGLGAALGIFDTIPNVIAAATQMVQSALSSASHALYDSSEGRYSGATTINNVKNYNLNVRSEQSSRSISYDFGIMQLLES